MPMTMMMTITMTMTMRPNVKVVIELEHKIIVGKFAQDEAKATQRLPIKAVESMFISIEVCLFRMISFWNRQFFLGNVR